MSSVRHYARVPALDVGTIQRVQQQKLFFFWKFQNHERILLYMASALVAPPTPHYYYTFTFHFAPRRTQAPQFHISLRDHPTSPLVYSHLTLSSHAHDALHFHFSLRPHAISALPASARNSHLTYDFLRVFTFHFSKNANFHVSLSGQKLGGGDLVVRTSGFVSQRGAGMYRLL